MLQNIEEFSLFESIIVDGIVQYIEKTTSGAQLHHKNLMMSFILCSKIKFLLF